MALNLPRWIALAFIACLLAPVLIFRAEDEPVHRYSQRDILATRANMATMRLRDAVERQRVTHVSDSLRASLPRASSSQFTVEYDRAFSAETRGLLAELASDAAIDRPAGPLVPIDLRFVLDSVPTANRYERRGFGGAMAIDYVLPGSGSERCLVVARIHPRLRLELASDIARERLLGPCGFYQAFGRPGPEVERWLRGQGWQFAQMATWRGEVRKWGGTRWIENDDYPLRLVIGERGYRCAVGNDAMCVDAVLQPRIRTFKISPTILTTSDFNPYTGSGYWYSRSWSFGQRSPYLLGDMVRDLGTERFARFWQSEGDLPAAFQAATNSDLAGWARGWLHRVYHKERAGPAASPAAMAWALTFIVLAIALSLRLAERRQMG